MKKYEYFEKGNIKEKYNEKYLLKKISLESIKNIYSNIKNIAGDFDKESYLEISNKCTLSYRVLLNDFKNGAFFSNNAFESMLALHLSEKDNKNIDVFHYNFHYKSLEKNGLEEKFDLIYSLFGISFEDIFSLLPILISYLKVNGVLALLIPAYWYIKENQTEIENDIISYSKQNDKKWLFVEPMDKLAEDNGCNLVEIKELPISLTVNRLELSYISSLEKLYKATLENNMAHLEVANIPEDKIELRTALVVFKKEKKILTKDNLFNL